MLPAQGAIPAVQSVEHLVGRGDINDLPHLPERWARVDLHTGQQGGAQGSEQSVTAQAGQTGLTRPFVS